MIEKLIVNHQIVSMHELLHFMCNFKLINTSIGLTFFLIIKVDPFVIADFQEFVIISSSYLCH